MSLAHEMGEVDVDGFIARIPSHKWTEWMAFLKLKAEREKAALNQARDADEVIDPRA